MALSIVISCFTCLSLILCVLFKPNIKVGKKEFQTFWIVTLIGALCILIFNVVPFDLLITKLTENSVVNPIKILTLFISLSVISITLDMLGFFKYLAIKVTNKFNNSQYGLFISLFILIAVLTIFTSNDIIILTFTPFICYFCKRLGVNPIPFLFMQFVVANTFSMTLYIGNPTNIYLAQSNNIDFFEYLKVMWLPTLFAGISSACILLLLFRKELNKKISKLHFEETTLDNKPLTIVALIILATCTGLLACSNYIGIDMWIICLASAILLTILMIVMSKEKFSLLKSVYKRVPYNLILFVLSMYTIVLSLNYNEVTVWISNVLSKVSNSTFIIFLYGGFSTLCDSLINNIPMSILFSSIISNNFTHEALYATVIGSNIGAYLTPLASLAGIMWLNMLKKQEVDFSFAKFIKYGIILTPVIAIFSFVGLSIVL